MGLTPEPDNSNNGGVVVRQDTGSGDTSDSTTRTSIVAAATPSESTATDSVEDAGDPDIPETADHVYKQGWLQLLGVVLGSVVILGLVKVLIMKKKHQRT